jgi:hypothetical protein
VQLSIDGADLTDRTWGFVTQVNVGLESVEEFKVEDSNSSAKFARPSTIVVSSRSGTNQFHGTAYETNRDSGYGVARRRQDTWSVPPFLVRNENGGSLGGPVIIPKVYNGKNRTFWFFSFEKSYQTSPYAVFIDVPTAAMRNGDFSNLKDSQGRLYTLYDPWTTNTQTWARQPFSYGGKLNAIDPSRISPVAKFLFSITPLPNLPDNPLVAPNLIVNKPNWSDVYSYSGRLDENISEKDRLFVRYHQFDSQAITGGVTDTIGLVITNPNVGILTDSTSDQAMVVGWTHTFSPRLFNELLVSGNKVPYHRISGALTDWDSQLGLPNPQNYMGFPQISNTGFTYWTFSSGNYRVQNQGNVIVDDNATKVSGRHELQFGAHYRYENMTALIGTTNGMGGDDFNTSATALYDPASARTNPAATPYTGQYIGNLFLGVANYMNKFQRQAYYLRDREYALYLQDNYKVSPRLTLNLGMRWEYWSPYRDKYGLMTSFDPNNGAIVLGGDLQSWYKQQFTLPAIVDRYTSLGAKFETYKDAGMPSSLMNSNWKNFGPRAGFAYRLGGGSRPVVLRGGYRMSYFRNNLTNWIYNCATNAPLNAYLQNNLNDPTTSPDGIGTYGMRSVPTIVAGVNSRNAVTLNNVSTLSRGSATAFYFAPNQPESRAQDWNLTLEKEVLPETLVRFGYVGDHQSNILQTYYYNSAAPTYIWVATTGTLPPTGEYASVATRPYNQQVYGNLVEYRKTGWTNYEGVRVEVEHRFSHDIGFQFFYVLGNQFGTSGGNADDFTAVYTNDQYMPGAVPSNYNALDRFLNYQRDTEFPKHEFRWNWVAGLPFGRGKWLGKNAGGVLDRVIGGWQVAGMGNLRSNYFSLPTNIYPNGNPIEIYGYKYPIQDCRSGVCYPGYLWWNGYIPANQINSYDPKTGKPNGVMGVPASYKPAGQPLIPWGSTALPANAPAGTNVSSYWDTNTVWLPLKDGTVYRTTYNNNLHPWRNQNLPANLTWGLDASLFKSIRITEHIKARLAGDFFNVLNHPGNPVAVAGDGIESVRNSGNNARVVQLSLRLIW